jgi:hypothetical protein
MKNILKLIAKAGSVKLKAHQCFKFDKQSDEHQVATYYKKTLNQLDDRAIKAGGIDQLREEIRTHKLQYHDREKITDLLLSIENFLLILKKIKITDFK